MSGFTPAGEARYQAARDDRLLPMTPRISRNVARGLLALSYPLRMAAHLTRQP